MAALPTASRARPQPRPIVFERIAIVAPGLLGASLAMAARKKQLAQFIGIYARRQEAVDTLESVDWCDFASTDLAEACRGAEFIVLCAPVERIIALSRELASDIEGNPIVTDVGSVKGDIVRFCQSALQGKGRFVGSHPMAGSEKTGMENASAALFEGRRCFITPTAQSDPEAVKAVAAFWEAVGARALMEDPDKHDEIVAQVSHLPHLIASSLASYLLEACPNSENYCGNGLRDTTRVASGDPGMWKEIIRQNRAEILRALNGYQDHLQSLMAAIANERDLEVVRRLADGKAFRDRL